MSAIATVRYLGQGLFSGDSGDFRVYWGRPGDTRIYRHARILDLDDPAEFLLVPVARSI